MRICPRCDHLSSDRAEHCEACGYQIVYKLSKPKPIAKTLERRRPVRAAKQPDRTFAGYDVPRETDRTWEGIGRLCELHGADCDPATCGLSDDLYASGVL